jgi:hypothetical protein
LITQSGHCQSSLFCSRSAGPWCLDVFTSSRGFFLDSPCVWSRVGTGQWFRDGRLLKWHHSDHQKLRWNTWQSSRCPLADQDRFISIMAARYLGKARPWRLRQNSLQEHVVLAQPSGTATPHAENLGTCELTQRSFARTIPRSRYVVFTYTLLARLDVSDHTAKSVWCVHVPTAGRNGWFAVRTIQ